MIYRLIILLLIVGCESTNSNKQKNRNLDAWQIKYFVNQNNEPSDVGYVTNLYPIMGEFASSKIGDNSLKVKLMIKERAVGIKLYEYEQNLSVKGSMQNPIEYDIKIKRNNENIDFIFRGINETDVVVVGNIISASHQDTLIHYLKKGGNFHFKIETNNQIINKVYKFDINYEAHSFIKIYNKLNSN